MHLLHNLICFYFFWHNISPRLRFKNLSQNITSYVKEMHLFHISNLMHNIILDNTEFGSSALRLLPGKRLGIDDEVHQEN